MTTIPPADKKAFIHRTSISRMQDSQLLVFVTDVLTRLEAPGYAAVQPYLEAVRPLLRAYAEALGRALRGGQLETAAKKEARAQLLAAFDQLASAVEAAVHYDPAGLMAAGFRLRTAARRYHGAIDAPVIERAVPTGVPGQVRLKLHSNLSRRLASMFQLEYSVDQGASWLHYGHSSRIHWVIQNMPWVEIIWLRARVLSTAGRQSNWSEPVMVRR